MKRRDATLLEQIEAEVVGDGPLAPTLRKCVVLGGQAGSVELRAWATKELKGYDTDDDVPEYRTVGAPILADAVTGNTIVKRQRIGKYALPEFAQEDIDERFTFREGIGGLEALIAQSAAKGHVDLSLPMAAELGRMMDQASGNPFQSINALYWTVSTAALQGIVDQVKTTLAELVAELRAGLPDEAQVPTAAAADQAVHVAVHGNEARVTVASSSSSGGATSTATVAPEPDDGWWTRSRRIGAAIAGLASIAGLGVAVAQWQGVAVAARRRGSRLRWYRRSPEPRTHSSCRWAGGRWPGGRKSGDADGVGHGRRDVRDHPRRRRRQASW